MKQVKIFTMMVAMLLMAITAHAGVNSKNTMPNPMWTTATPNTAR